MMVKKEPMLVSVKEWSAACCLFSPLWLPSTDRHRRLSLSPSCPAPPLFITPRLSKSARGTEPSPFCHLQR